MNTRLREGFGAAGELTPMDWDEPRVTQRGSAATEDLTTD
jgi:hypothetical protein